MCEVLSTGGMIFMTWYDHPCLNETTETCHDSATPKRARLVAANAIIIDPCHSDLLGLHGTFFLCLHGSHPKDVRRTHIPGTFKNDKTWVGMS